MIDKDWFLKRFADAGLSMAQIGERLGHTDRSAMSRTMKGERRMQMSEAVSIAKLLGLSLDDVLRHAGVEVVRESKAQIQVSGVVNAKGEIRRRHKDAPRSAERPGVGVSGHCQALVIEAPGNVADGWMVYFEPARQVEPDAVGKLAVVQSDGSRYLVELERGMERGIWNLRGVCGMPDRLGRPIESAAPVLWIRA